ncbi:MAG: hypothetical protein ACR2H1_12310, partial [Limisphaerales bacterium]
MVLMKVCPKQKRLAIASTDVFILAKHFEFILRKQQSLRFIGAEAQMFAQSAAGHFLDAAVSYNNIAFGFMNLFG